ncbi:hypothetical protein FL966_09235 [Caproiciproducens galactitolivorans]|uniref:YcxB-like protein domain-containing protein n=1 Tax=Caproiciproducens galactitolivorans TaxID=642589 RepID=A0A4Z0Y212_9FIRM|nr:hypothetical protein [Caproiciproducens galactitolivorans]QEY35207.1 hypothetical protein FL966_09235 [Caproiciproducens galactitolivorans]TGJ76897.1 hypothetical protein CAGA_09700 [Caproiciproducens galactitolivorans]
MPTFYGGGPIETVSQTISSEDYANAYYAAYCASSPLRRRWVRAGIFLSAAIVIASCIPCYRAHFSTFWVPCGGIVLALAFCFLFGFVQPNDLKKWGARLYRSNALWSIPQQVEIYRDSVVIKNSYEQILEYWTDFSMCMETGSAFIAAGGRERELLIIKKQDLPNERVEAISAALSGAFAARYLKSGH